MKTVVLAYSGGLDTSVAIPLLKERYDYDRVITVVADVGQPAPKCNGGSRPEKGCVQSRFGYAAAGDILLGISPFQIDGII